MPNLYFKFGIHEGEDAVQIAAFGGHKRARPPEVNFRDFLFFLRKSKKSLEKGMRAKS